MMNWRKTKKIFLKSLAPAILVLVLCRSVRNLFLVPKSEIVDDFKIFMSDWCRVREARTNLDTVLASCKNQTKWNPHKTGIATNGSTSFITRWELKPAGQFSRFFIQAVSSEKRLKTTGGDWWRIFIRSPVASFKPTVFDLRDGTYEVVFLVVEPGVYRVEITLDYTLCDGFRDPPDDWFIQGDAQGKRQPRGTLEGRAESDYLLQPFQNGEPITMNIQLPDGKGIYQFNDLPEDFLGTYVLKGDFTCGMPCQLIWDGYGRWTDDKWKPYLKARKTGGDLRKDPFRRAKRQPQYDTLWIYGDSHARRTYNEVKDSSLCTTLFDTCKLTSYWVYVFASEFPPNDDLDFNHTRIVEDVRRSVNSPEMKGNSVLLLNFGLHYMQSTNFSNYAKLLRRVAEVLKAGKVKEGRESVRVIWKTTTEISKHKDTDESLYSDFKRFLNNARVAMFNGFATSLMCLEGFEILDVNPLTASYPKGTGGPDVEFYKEHDIVHFQSHVTRPFEDVLTEYLVGNLPQELTLENYQFS